MIHTPTGSNCANQISREIPRLHKVSNTTIWFVTNLIPNQCTHVSLSFSFLFVILFSGVLLLARFHFFGVSHSARTWSPFRSRVWLIFLGKLTANPRKKEENSLIILRSVRKTLWKWQISKARTVVVKMETTTTMTMWVLNFYFVRLKWGRATICGTSSNRISCIFCKKVTENFARAIWRRKSHSLLVRKTGSHFAYVIRDANQYFVKSNLN